jgi:hypothetical protein
LKRLKDFDLSGNSFSTLPFPFPTRARPKTETMEHYRISPFQDLNITDACVSNVSVNTVCAVPAISSTRTPSDGLSGRSVKYK